MSAIETTTARVPWTASETTPSISEDWLSVIIGLFIFVLALAALANVDLIGWAVTTSVWSNLGEALGTASKSYAPLGGAGALVATYAALLAVLSAAAVALKADVKKFALAFTAVFAIAYASWIVGSYANFAAVTPAELQKFGISWSLRLTNEGGFVFALVAGLIIANVFPRFAETIKEAVRPELYIKIAIVILGGFFAVTAAGKLNLATSLLLRGVAAIIEAYLIYWAVVYFVARKWFGFNREWAAPLASGISICGVSAAIATGGAIRARPIVPVLVSSLVVVFAVIEVLILPFLAQTFLWREPLVAGAWIGLAVKTDGAAVAGGGITEVVDSREVGGRRREISTRLDSRHHRHGESVHRHFHRHLGVRARLHLDQLCQRDLGKGENRRDLAALPQVHPRVRADVSDRSLPCARNPRRCRRESARRNRGGQHLPRDLLHPDVLLDRRSVQLQEAVAGGHRQARRRLRHQPVRLRDLGRLADFLAVLCRHQTAAGRLILQERYPMSQTDIGTELRRAAPEPLLPVEKKLIGFSLGTGLVLLLALALLNYLLPATF